jgi:hypothetical protein
MRLEGKEVVCTNCFSTFKITSVPKSTFLGFQKIVCPGCDRQSTYPLRTDYLITCWVVIGIMALASVLVIANGGIPMTGVLVIAAIVVIIKNAAIKSKISDAWNNHRNPG